METEGDLGGRLNLEDPSLLLRLPSEFLRRRGPAETLSTLALVPCPISCLGEGLFDSLTFSLDPSLST